VALRNAFYVHMHKESTFLPAKDDLWYDGRQYRDEQDDVYSQRAYVEIELFDTLYIAQMDGLGRTRVNVHVWESGSRDPSMLKG
jgi:hypothetical protein